MDYFKGLNNKERYDNEVLNELRKQTFLLEQIAQLLQQKHEGEVTRPRKRQQRRDNA